jgi:predicted RNase H-like nuclease (RuvC/YqgF family)
MVKSNWVDAVIRAEIDSGNPAAIATAVANHPRFVEAIRRALAKKPASDSEEPSHAQIIAEELREEMAAN